MAISRCNEIVISRKKFSDFALYDPTTREDCKNLFLAGYIEDELGQKQNVKLKAMSFINSSLGDVIGSLDPDSTNDLITIVNHKINEQLVRIATVNYDNTNFVQINNVNDTLFYNFDGKEYFCIRLSDNIPLGTVIRFYLPNFPKNKGVILFPTSDNKEYKEVFFNDDYSELTALQSDYYFTIIQLADPKDKEGTNITTRAKVIEVNNITSED